MTDEQYAELIAEFAQRVDEADEGWEDALKAVFDKAYQLGITYADLVRQRESELVRDANYRIRC